MGATVDLDLPSVLNLVGAVAIVAGAVWWLIRRRNRPSCDVAIAQTTTVKIATSKLALSRPAPHRAASRPDASPGPGRDPARDQTDAT